MTAAVLILAALLAPWVTMMPLNEVSPYQAVTTSPHVIWRVGLLWALAAMIWPRDKWLAVFVAYVTLNALRTPFMASPWTHATTITLAAWAFVMLRGHLKDMEPE
jgi:hypothetical protein